MAKKRNQVNVDLENIEGNTTVAGGKVVRTDQQLADTGGGERSDVTVVAKGIKGDTVVAGGDVIDAITFNARLDDLVRQLRAYYAADPETRGQITVLAGQLAEEAQRPPAERDASRAQRWLEGLRQFALEASAGAASQMLADAFRTTFLS